LSATGTGDLFFAQDARKIMVLDLNNERMTGQRRQYPRLRG
jgi:hypothetical protein